MITKKQIRGQVQYTDSGVPMRTAYVMPIYKQFGLSRGYIGSAYDDIYRVRKATKRAGAVESVANAFFWVTQGKGRIAIARISNKIPLGFLMMSNDIVCIPWQDGEKIYKKESSREPHVITLDSSHETINYSIDDSRSFAEIFRQALMGGDAEFTGIDQQLFDLILLDAKAEFDVANSGKAAAIAGATKQTKDSTMLLGGIYLPDMYLDKIAKAAMAMKKETIPLSSYIASIGKEIAVLKEVMNGTFALDYTYRGLEYFCFNVPVFMTSTTDIHFRVFDAVNEDGDISKHIMECSEL